MGKPMHPVTGPEKLRDRKRSSRVHNPGVTGKAEKSVSSSTFKRAKDPILTALRSIAEDSPDNKARKAIDGMLPCGKPAHPISCGCDAALVYNEEKDIATDLLQDAPTINHLTNALASLRYQIKTLALGYTKLQSDMFAIQTQRANEANFALTMGDAFKFKAFLDQHFKLDVMNNPGIKTLDVAEMILLRLKNG